MRLNLSILRLLTSLALAGSPSLGSAEALAASYIVVVGGITVTEVEALFDIRRTDYRLRTTMQTRGVASLFGRGEQTTEAAGVFRGTEPVPAQYLTVGVWRGKLRHIRIDYPPSASGPVLRVLEPPEAPGERDPVPPELRRGTLDPLSVLVKLSRLVTETNRCDGAAAVFDGRRRSDAVARTTGRELLPQRRWVGHAWSGEALRCELEWRQVAGFLRGQDQGEQSRVNTGIGWIAPAWPGGPVLPVRAELPTRWFGTMHLYLMRAVPARERALDSQRAGQPQR
jgi:hypothetical protein